MVERIAITSPDQWHALRRKDLTASTFAALAGLHPYKTVGELYAEKALGLDFSGDETVAMRRGRIMEPTVALAVAEERPQWKIEKAHEYLRDGALRLGCTPDFYFRDEAGRRGVLQTKTVAKHVFDKHWDESPPPWVTLQNAVECMLDDADVGCTAALIIDGYYFDCVLFDVPRHTAAETRIRDMAAKFWRDVDAGIMPKVDYERDGDLIRLMYPVEVEGKVVDLRADNRMPELLAERDRLAAAVKDAEAAKVAVDNEIKMKLADAESALVNGWRVTLKAQTRTEHVVKESTFRMLRTKKESAAA